MLSTAILVGIILFLIFWWYRDRIKVFQTFKTMGIPGPEPRLLFGNMDEIRKEGFHKKLAGWRKVYGPTYGYFDGPRPVLVTSDVELLKQILIKDFNKFHDRKPLPLDDSSDKFRHLINASGTKWKRLRTITSPSFSGRRMKEMSPLIHEAIEGFMEVLDERFDAGDPFDIHSEFQRLTMTAIAACAFGVEVNALKDADHAFLQHGRRMFAIVSDDAKFRYFWRSLFVALATIFPRLGRFLRRLPTIDPRVWVLKAAAKILHARMEQKADRVDFVQLMLDAREGDYHGGDLTMTLDDEDFKSAPVTPPAAPSGGKKGLQMEEMQAQCMVLLLAGYETTSTALGLIAYHLALCPDKQHKLQQEIDKHFPPGEERPEYDTIQKLPYLDMVLSEVLRMYPIAVFVATRRAVEDCEVGGLHIPKGTYVQVNMDAVHHDPDLWGPEDPDQFLPERFSPDRKQSRHALAWMPFGTGPRNCAGMRFALLEDKLTLVYLLRKYTIERCQQTLVPLPLNKHAIRGPSSGVVVKLRRRETFQT